MTDQRWTKLMNDDGEHLTERETAHGWRFPFVATSRILQYIYYVLFKRGQFVLDGRTFSYFYHLYNPTFRVERCAEIPIVLAHLSNELETLEVGNVLAHYTAVKHDVVDKYEKMEGVINEDVVSFKPNKTFDLIVSISTLEHVGWDEEPKDREKIPAAIANLKRLLKPGNK